MADPQMPTIHFVYRTEVPATLFREPERAVLFKVNQKVAAAESLEAILDFLFETTQEILPCDRIAMAFVNEADRRVVCRYVRANYEKLYLKTGYAEDLDGSSLKSVIHRGCVRLINDLPQYSREHPDSRSTRIILREGIRSSMTCPLGVGGHNIGLLFRSSRKPNAYDDRMVQLHWEIAERISQAVEKAWRIDQLQTAYTAYMEMLGFVSHELKGPVGSIITDGRLLLEGYLGELDEKQRDRIRRMISKGEHLLNLVREYLDLSQLEGGQLRARPHKDIDFICEVVEPAIELLETQIIEKHMRLVRCYHSESLPSECDPALMKVVVTNLLSNAIKYGNEGSDIRLCLEPHDDHLRCRVWNQGPGFPSSERFRLFHKFSRLDTPELRQQKGTGVGLYTVWRIVQLHGGRMHADSEYGKWAEFAFDIPQPLGTTLE